MASSPLTRWIRVGVTVSTIVVVQAAVCAAAALLPASIVWWIWRTSLSDLARLAIVAAAAVPLYVLFALALLVVSPVANRLTRASTPPGLCTRIADFEWPLLQWARYMVAGQLVRVLAGSLFKGSPMWTFYLRLNGARIGRRVFVNTVAISDHNLLALGNDVIIGADVHLSGHTVERGMLLTGPVTVGAGVTIGLGSIVSIDTVIADRCQIGALTFVPKHMVLDAAAVYAGVPAHRLH